MKNTSFQNSEKGIAIVFALGFISLLFLLAIGFLTSSIIQKDIGQNNNNLTTTRLLAEAGLQRTIAAMKLNSLDAAKDFSNVYTHEGDGSKAYYEDLKELLPTTVNDITYYSWPNNYNPSSDDSVTWQYIKDEDGKILYRFAYVTLPTKVKPTNYKLFGEKIDLSASVDNGLNAEANGVDAVSEDYPPIEATSIDVNGNPVIGRPGRDVSELFLSTISFIDKTDTAIKLSVTNANPEGLLQYGQHWGSLNTMCDSFNYNETPINNIQPYKNNCIFDAIPTPEAFACEDSYDVRTGTGLYHRFNLTRNDWDGVMVDDINDIDTYLKPFSKNDDGNIEKCIPWIANWKSKGDFPNTDLCKKQIAANLKDYNDSNNTATTDSSDAPTYVGLEKCPYINEIKLKIEGEVTESSGSVFINGNLEINGDNNSLIGGYVNGNIQFSDMWRSNNTTNGQILNYYGSVINLGINNPDFSTEKATSAQTMPIQPDKPTEPADIEILDPEEIDSLEKIDLGYYENIAVNSNTYFNDDIEISESGSEILVKYRNKSETVSDNSIIYCKKSITVSGSINRKVTLISKNNITLNGANISISPADTARNLQIYTESSLNISQNNCSLGGNVYSKNSISITKNNCTIGGYLCSDKSITFDGWGSGGSITTGAIQCGSNFTINSSSNTISGNLKCDGNVSIVGTGSNTFTGAMQCAGSFTIGSSAINNVFNGNVDITNNITTSSGGNTYKGLLLSRNGDINIKGWETQGYNKFEGNVKSGSSLGITSLGNNFYGSVYAVKNININNTNNVFNGSIQSKSLNIAWQSSNNTISGSVKCEKDITINGSYNTVNGAFYSTAGNILIQSNDENSINSIVAQKDIAIKNPTLKVDNILWADGDFSIPWASTHSINKICVLGSISMGGSIVNNCEYVWCDKDITLQNGATINTKSLACNGSLYLVNSNNGLAAGNDSTTYTANVSIQDIDLELVNMYNSPSTCNARVMIGGTYKWILDGSETLVNYTTTGNIDNILAAAKSYTVPVFTGTLSISPENTQTGESGLLTSIEDFKITSLKVRLTDTGSNLLDFAFIEPSTDYSDKIIDEVEDITTKNKNDNKDNNKNDGNAGKGNDNKFGYVNPEDLFVFTAFAKHNNGNGNGGNGNNNGNGNGGNGNNNGNGNGGNGNNNGNGNGGNGNNNGNEEQNSSEASSRILSSDGTTGILYFDYQISDPRQNLNTSDWNDVEISSNSNDIGTIDKVNINFIPNASKSSDPEPDAKEPWELSTAFIRNAPMLSPWELGFIHRGAAFQTINLKTYNSSEGYNGGGSSYSDGDANILDQIKMTSNTQTYGKININSGIEEVLKTLFAKIRVGSDIASTDGPGTLKTSNDSQAPYIADKDAETIAESLIKINGEGTDSSKQFYTRTQILSNSSIANMLTSFNSTYQKNDAGKEEIIGKFINLSTALRQLPDEFQVIVVAQAIKDLGELNGAECQTGKYDIGKDTILATQKILATVRRNPVNDKFYIIDFEYIN